MRHVRPAPANTRGIRHIAFAVEDIDAVVAGLRARGAELVGELERYQDSYRLCYVRGPEGIIIELAEADRLTVRRVGAIHPRDGAARLEGHLPTLAHAAAIDM